MEAVASNWSSIHNNTINGHAIVAAVITNGKITIPITFKTWYSAKTFPERHQTRIQLAQELMNEIKTQYPYLMFLLDGAFSSEDMLRFCERNFIKFCMRFNSNKKVVIAGLTEPLIFDFCHSAKSFEFNDQIACFPVANFM